VGPRVEASHTGPGVAHPERMRRFETARTGPWPRSSVLLCIVSNTLCYATTGRPEWLTIEPHR
jgi:hypothetical protein